MAPVCAKDCQSKHDIPNNQNTTVDTCSIVNEATAPGKRCPKCTDVVWVLPGRCCPHCGTYVG